jgi:hypothetical protein
VTVSIYDINANYVADFTTYAALGELLDEVRKNPLRWQKFHAFLEEGCGWVKPDLLKEVKEFMAVSNNRMLKDVAKDLLEILKHTKKYAIISE